MCLKELLNAAFRKTRYKPTVFCSSDVGDIEGGTEWLEEIMRHLRAAKVCIALVTPRSAFGSPWVAYESGGAYLRFKADAHRSRLFPVCANGIPPSNVPPIFRHLQVRTLSKPSDLLALVKEVASCLNRKAAPIPSALVKRVVAEASLGSPHWRYVNQALVGQRQGASPFSFESLVSEATTEIACAGFSLHYIATSARCKAEIFKFLRNAPERTVRLLVADPTKPRYLAIWRLIGPTFLADLKQSVRMFSSWLREAKREGLAGKLEVGLTPFVGVTVVCVDPESSDALLVITPSIVGKSLSSERPHMV